VFDPVKYRKYFAKMIVAHEYPFNCVTHHFLKAFVSDLQPNFKMLSRNTVRLDCINFYEEKRCSLYDLFDKLDCRFSFTSDLWISKGENRGFMALTCHYIDDGWNLRKKIINFTSLSSPYPGLTQVIYDKVVLWNLDKKTLCLVYDNSSINDACIKELFNTSLKTKFLITESIFHQKCGCHILNLIVQDELSVLCDEINNIREMMKYICHSQ
jgi:hypothetical protein